MSLKASETTVESDDNQHTTTYQTIKPALESVAVALTFAQTIRNFAQDAPSKLKWCDLSNTDMKRFCHYNIITEAEMNMGSQVVWTLADWVETLLDNTNRTFNFSTKQIRIIRKNKDFLLSSPDEFEGSNAPVGNRKLGQLRSLGLLEFEDDNRQNHKTTTWTRTDRMDRLCEIYEKL